MSEQKRWKFLVMVWDFIENIQKKATNLAHVHVRHQSSFFRKYRNTSLAIMNNFSTLTEALSMSKQYEVPLIHFSVADNTEEKFMWQFVLNCFQNAQILNQGFIFWPQFSKIYASFQKKPDLLFQDASKEDQGVIKCYCNEKIKELPSNQEQIYEILNKLRSDYYYILNQNAEEKGQFKEKFKLPPLQQKPAQYPSNQEQSKSIQQAKVLQRYNQAALDSQSDNDQVQRCREEKDSIKMVEAKNEQFQSMQELFWVNQASHIPEKIKEPSKQEQKGKKTEVDSEYQKFPNLS